jgi:hypothetical protein
MLRLCALLLAFSLGFMAPSVSAFAQTAAAKPDAPPQLCGGRGNDWAFLLRSDFTDLGPLSCTHDSATAQGATLSWTNNLFTGQNSAAADGLATLIYSCYGHNCGASWIEGFSIGPYLQGDNTYQFQPSKTQLTNGYTLIPGGFAEIAFSRPFGDDDFRIRDGEAFADTQISGQVRSNSFVGEWIPSFVLGHGLNIGYTNELGTTGLYYVLTPELMVQYDRLYSGTTSASIFSTRNESLRIGPQASLLLVLDPNKIPMAWPDIVREFLKGASTTITNHESWDEYSGRQFSWTQVSVTYTFPKGQDQASHFGVTASYGYGNAEATANKTNQMKVGLAVKF